MKIIPILLTVLWSTSAAAQETGSKDQSPVLTRKEAGQLYELGIRAGVLREAQFAVQSMQADMKPILDKLAPPKQP